MEKERRYGQMEQIIKASTSREKRVEMECLNGEMALFIKGSFSVIILMGLEGTSGRINAVTLANGGRI